MTTNYWDYTDLGYEKCDRYTAVHNMLQAFYGGGYGGESLYPYVHYYGVIIYLIECITGISPYEIRIL